MTNSDPSVPVTRRTVLASLAAGGSTLIGGCMRRLRTMTGLRSPGQVTLRVKSAPADADPHARAIARRLAEWYRTAGIDAGVTPLAEEELRRQVLLDHEFDVFVARIPGKIRDPDALYSLLHSRYATALGWHNPFGYTNADVDDLLETQRRTDGETRHEAVADLQRGMARTQPFTVIAFPEGVRAGRSGRYTNWREVDLGSAMGYLKLTGSGETVRGTDREETHLRIASVDPRATENLNPLSVEYRRTDPVLALLYDSLGYVSESDAVEPWLARSWTLTDDDAPVATVRLRDDLTWHDGEPLTAGDVAFTYAFLADTSGGDEDGEDPIPAPRFRGRSSLVADARPLDEGTLEVEFVECPSRVATRAFTVPVLPEHVWADRTDAASVGGADVPTVTEAVATNNVPPVGSGPLSFVRNTPRESLTLERFDGHFLSADSSVPSGVEGGPAFDRLTMRVVGSDVAAVEMVVSGEADLTATPVGSDTTGRIEQAEALELLVDPSARFYFVGYNARRPSLTNPRFRNVLAHLVDEDHLVNEVFDGYAQAAATPLAGTEWLPPGFEWEGTDPSTPFLGRDGELNVERARDAFREIGYRYHDGVLVGE